MVIDKKQIEILKDTTLITGPILELLSNGSNADGYHTHSASIATKHTYTSGNLTTDIAAIGATPTTLYIDVITDLGGSATVPKTMNLKFIDAGQITIDASETLTIFGNIEAGFWHIFDAVDEFTSLVEFGTLNTGGGRADLHPEWWGALGDSTTDDTIPIQKMLRVPSIYGSQIMKIVFAAGKIYRVTSTLQFGLEPTGPGVRNSTYIIKGNGSTLKFDATLLGANTAIKFGNITNKLLPAETNAQVYYTTWNNLNISSTSGFGEPGSTGVEIGSCQFTIFEDSVWGGFDTVVATRPDQYGGNSNRFSDINVGGWTSYGWLIGDTLQANAWTIEGGRTQQGEGPAMRIYGSTQIIVRNIDFSVVRANIIELDSCSHIVLDNIYSENFQLYWEAYPLINDVKLIYITGNSNLITINNCRINGVGIADVARSDAAYGIYIDGYVSNITISGNVFTQHYIADIYVGEDTDKIFIKADNHFSSPVGTGVVNMPQISDMSGRAHNDHRFAELYSNAHAPWPGNQKNLIASPNDFTNTNVWTLSNVVVNGTTLGPDGVSFAQVVEFPNTSYAGDTGNPSSFAAKNVVFSLGETLNNKTIILQYWIKALDILATALDGNTNSFVTNMRVFATPIDNSNGGIEMPFTRAGYYINNSGWILMKHRYKPTGHIDNLPYMGDISFRAYAGGDAISVGLYGVQVYVESDEHIKPISAAWGIFDKVSEPPEIIPKLINYTGEVADFIMETIPDPAVPAGPEALQADLVANTIPALRRNISDITEQVNSIRLLMKNYGFMKPFSVFDMTGLTMYMSPKFGAESPIDMDPIDNIYFAYTPDPQFYPLTNTGTNRPTYLDGYINNLPTIHFDVAQDQNLVSNSSLDKFITVSEFVVLVVTQVESIDAPSGATVNNDCIVGSPSGGQFGIFLGNTEMIYGVAYDGVTFVTPGTSIPGFQIPFLVEYRLNGGNVSIRVNDNATSSLATNNLTAISSLFCIGGRGLALPYFDGYMAELIIINQYNSVEVEKARNMLNDKYNLW